MNEWRWIVDDITGMLIWLGFFTAVFFAYLYYLRFRNKERTLLIEKNVDLKDIYSREKKAFPWYILGFTVLGTGLGFTIGLLIGIALEKSGGLAVREFSGLMTLALSVVFGAIGMIIGHNIEQKKKKLRG